MNVQDSLHMRGLLSRIGYQSVDEPFEADLILLVGCSVREKAVDKVYSDLGRIRRLVKDNPDLIVGLAGCVAQQEKKKLLQRFPFLDLIFGPDAIRELPEMVKKVINEKKKGKMASPVLRTRFHSRKDFEFVNLITNRDENRASAYVNIQKGCDNVCSYCIVPQVRGGEVSRPSKEIVDEVKALVDLGVKDVTLLGQNVNSYGLKDPGEISFPKLLEKIASETDLKRLRFTTPHPKDVKEDLINLFKDLEILPPHFHLPVQSGSNRILKAMRRYYTREDYLNQVELLRKARENIAITTDIIVGFPGEEEKDFQDTLDLVGKVEFDLSYSFAYSPRPGTKALSLDGKVSSDEKKRRLEILLKIQRDISGRKNRKLEGSVEEVLVEGFDDSEKGWFGRTGTNKIVHIHGDMQHNKKDDLVGQFINVIIKKGNRHSLIGEVSYG